MTMIDGHLSRTTEVSRYQTGFTRTKDSEWQWHQLGYMQICMSPQTDNNASTNHSVFHRPDALPDANQQRQSTEGNLISLKW